LSVRALRGRRGAAFSSSAIAALCLALASPGGARDAHYRDRPASPDGIGKVYYGREIAQVMGFRGAAWLERPERAAEERPEWLVEDLHLQPGMAVADIGAGSGYLTRRLARHVPKGRVYAVDVQPPMVDLLRAIAAEADFRNVVPVLGSPDDVKLARDTIDVAVMVDVYHELEFPAEVMQSILRALKPGGRRRALAR
jgi:SAM-dependent methyltransferase